jgi:type IX secretion system PorP/SprF family membrane protein
MIKLSVKFLVAMAIVFSSIASYGQQEAQYTQFMYNKILVNPGFAGARRAPSVSALYRNQWMDYNGHPQSYLVSFDANLGKSRIGTGLVLHRQTEGIMTRSAADVALSYDILHTEQSTLRIGMSATVREFQFSLQDPEVYIKDSKDALLTPETPKTLNANIGTGLYFDNKNYYFGVSVPNLMKRPISLKNNLGATYLGTEQQHVYVMAGGFFDLFGNSDVNLKPSVMYKYVKNTPFSMDANMSVMFRKTFMAGVSYRFGGKEGISGLKNGNGDSIDLLTFFQATDQLGVGLAYDFTLSKLSSYTKGSFELVTRYDFIPSITRVLHNPRIFF